MIVCVCNAIREDELHDAARRGATEPLAAYKSLGCEPLCGCCLDCAQEVIDDVHARSTECTRASMVLKFPRAA